jgi:hypothetical protein
VDARGQEHQIDVLVISTGFKAVTHLEAQANDIVAAIKVLGRGVASWMEVRNLVSQWFNSIIQQRLAGDSFEGGNNYYKSNTGRIATQWADGAILYSVLTKLLRRAEWKTRYIVLAADRPPTSRPRHGRLSPSASQAIRLSSSNFTWKLREHTGV